jgi:hypothetical protein
MPTMTTLTDPSESLPYIGDFTPEDRAQIEALRRGQAAAIEKGDADAYARLRADRARIFESHRCLLESLAYRMLPVSARSRGDAAMQRLS